MGLAQARPNYSRICNLIGGHGSPDSAKKNAHSPQTHLPCLIKWRPEVGMGTRLVRCEFTGTVHVRNGTRIWGEPERAPHLREVRHRCLYVYIYIYIYVYMYNFLYVPYVVLGHGTNLCRVQNGQDGRPLRSRCVRLKYSLRKASNEKEVVRNEAYAPTSQPGKNKGIVRRNSAN